MSNRILGLEIGNSAVSAVILNSGIKGSFVEAQARVPLEGPQDFGSNLSHALAILAEEIDITGTTCAVSLPAGSVSFRNVRLPFRDKKKLRQVLPYELEPQLPYPVEDLVIDYYNADPNRIDSSELVATAVKKTTIESLLAALGPYGLDPVTITAGGFATALCLGAAADQPANWLLTDIDGDTLSLFFAEKGTLKMTRATRLPTGGELAANHFFRQVRHSLLAYRAVGHPDFEPQTLFVTDSGLIHFQSEQEIADNLKIPVDRADLLAHMNIKALQDNGQIFEPNLTENALALAYMELTGLKGLNFRKGPFERKKQWVVHRKSIVAAGLFALLVLMLAFANILVDTYLLEKKVARLNQDIVEIFKTTLPGVKRIVDPLQQMQVKLRDARKTLLLPAQTGKNIRTIDILNELSSGIPQKADVELTRVVISQESILISGNTDTFNSVDDIQNHLEKAPVFRKVTISSANLEKSGNRINFKLKVQL